MERQEEKECPRCLGKGRVDKDDIIRLKRESEWAPGTCAYCEGNGKVTSEFTDSNKVDDAEIVDDSGVDIEALLDLAKSMKEKENNESVKPGLPVFVISVLSVLFLVILSFVYVYLTALNPIIYLNFIAWFIFSTLLLIPVSMLGGDDTMMKVGTSVVLSIIAVYLVIGMESSVYYTTYMDAFLNGGSMMLPKASISEIFETLFSWDVYKEKMDFLSHNNSFSISYKGRRNGADIGALKPMFRYIEAGGIFVLPLYRIAKSHIKKGKLIKTLESVRNSDDEISMESSSKNEGGFGASVNNTQGNSLKNDLLDKKTNGPENNSSNKDSLETEIIEEIGLGAFQRYSQGISVKIASKQKKQEIIDDMVQYGLKKEFAEYLYEKNK